jgi:hypothetical protein
VTLEMALTLEIKLAATASAAVIRHVARMIFEPKSTKRYVGKEGRRERKGREGRTTNVGQPRDDGSPQIVKETLAAVTGCNRTCYTLGSGVLASKCGSKPFKPQTC